MKAPEAEPCETPPAAYTAILLKEAGANGRYYLQERIRPDKRYFGRIAMFGGHRETGETPEQCAIRELEEETDEKFEQSELAKVALVKTFDDRGDVAIGQLFFIDKLDPRRIEPRRISSEGRLVRLYRRDLARNYAKFTPITAFALQLFGEYEKGFGCE